MMKEKKVVVSHFQLFSLSPLSVPLHRRWLRPHANPSTARSAGGRDRRRRLEGQGIGVGEGIRTQGGRGQEYQGQGDRDWRAMGEGGLIERGGGRGCQAGAKSARLANALFAR